MYKFVTKYVKPWKAMPIIVMSIHYCVSVTHCFFDFNQQAWSGMKGA